MRHELERWPGFDDEPAQLMVRFGTAPQVPYSIGQPFDDVTADRAPND